MIVHECTSTNDLAEMKATEGAPHGFVVISETQTNGRGREGREWVSPFGGIWLTLLIRPDQSSNLSALPLVCALAVCRAANKDLAAHSKVRWPNDVMINDRKLAGVLAQAKVEGTKFVHVLVGIGLNANFQTNQIEAIRGMAVSMLDMLGTPIHREPLICSMLYEAEQMYELLESTNDDQLLSMIRQVDWSRGRNVRIKTSDRQITGAFDDYTTLSKARIRTERQLVVVETNDVVSVEYESN